MMIFNWLFLLIWGCKNEIKFLFMIKSDNYCFYNMYTFYDFF